MLQHLLFVKSSETVHSVCGSVMWCERLLRDGQGTEPLLRDEQRGVTQVSSAVLC